jgi:hypothetical protein
MPRPPSNHSLHEFMMDSRIAEIRESRRRIFIGSGEGAWRPDSGDCGIPRPDPALPALLLAVYGAREGAGPKYGDWRAPF